MRLAPILQQHDVIGPIVAVKSVSVFTSEIAVDHMVMLSVTGTTSFSRKITHAVANIPTMFTSTRAIDIPASIRY